MSSHLPNGDAGPSRLPEVVVHSHRTLHPFFTPTHVRFSDTSSHDPTSEWNSRRARKGRYQRRGANLKGNHGTGTKSEGGRLEGFEGIIERDIIGRVKREESKLKPGLWLDVSWWEAVAFTFGSMVWVVNGFTVWFPILRPPLDTQAFSYTAAGLAFIGGTVFEIGSYLMVIEALDRGREISFGTALGRLLHHRRTTSPNSSEKLGPEHHSASSGDASPPGTSSDPKRGDVNEKDLDLRTYVWWGKPMWHDLGYCAAIVQLFAATVFWISTITGLPGVIPGFFSDSSSKVILDIFFWTPQVIGGTGFIVSSLILMLEVQHAWWKINPLDIGWHVGFWNLIGALGFMLCGALGYSSSSKCEYHSALATFWGSWAFLIGSGCQIWEVIWREPS